MNTCLHFIKNSFFLLLIFSAAFLNTNSQNVTRVEYFVDTDPGFGIGNNVPITPGLDISANFQFNINTLPAGFHNLFIRSYVNPYLVVEEGKPVTKGGWSLVQNRTFYKENISIATTTLPNIVKGEYFIDTDPGFEKGINIPLTSANDISNLGFAFDLTTLGAGFHNLYVRFKDAWGNWSLCSVRNFYKEAISNVSNVRPNITKGEYFIDTDPGFGSGTNIPFTAANDINNLSFTFDITAVPAGFHTLQVRFRDANNAWGHASVRTFYKENLATTGNLLPDITGGEFFIDQDPGLGSGKPISVTPGKDLTNVSFSADLTSIAAGFHNISTRFRDANGLWGLSNSRSFYKETFASTGPLSNIVRLEYFVDNDPGFGEGSSVSVTPATDITALTFPINMTNVSIGNHRIYVRALDAAGKWSLVSNGSFQVEPPAAIYITIGNLPVNACAGASLNIPFSVNTPYGSNNVFTAQLSDAAGNFSNPVNIGSFTGNNTDTIRSVIPANSASGNGYRIRILSSSPIDTSAVSGTSIVINRVPGESFAINGKSQACIGTEQYSASIDEPNTTYNWVLSGGGTITSNGATASVNWTAGGTYTLTLTASNTCGSAQPRTLSVVVSAGGTPTISASGTLTFCEGGTVVLTSSATVGNTWSTGATTQSITVSSSGSYSVTVGAGACAATSANTVVTVNPSTTATFAAIAPICSGSAAPVLPGTSINGISGTWSPSVVSNTSSGTYIFTPSSGQCIVAEPLSVVVNPTITPVFEAIPPISPGSVAPVLPTTSQNGITGTWSPATVSNTQTATYTFTPAGTQCATTATLTVVVQVAPDLSVQNVASNLFTVSPNETIVVSWDVANVGTATSPVDWTERIYIQTLNGANRTLLGQSVFTTDGVLNIGQTVSRSASVIIPAQLAVGDQGVLVVELIPAAVIQEPAGANSNNTGIQQSPLTFRKLLTLNLSAAEITEASANGLTATVNRSGSLTSALTVNISLDKAERFSFPSSLIIPAGQAGASFTFTAIENNSIEGPIKDTVRLSATGFQQVKAGFTVLDNDNPSLSITNLPAEALEGAAVTFQVTTDLSPAVPLQVFLTSANQLRFPVPSSVTIPAGSTSSTVTVSLALDEIPEIDIPVIINAGASGHNPANASIQVNDDDLPGLELTLQTTTVAESAGYFATQATLRRTAKSNPIAFTANLSSSLQNTLILPPTLSLAAGENEKTFTIGVIDNAFVDSQRTISITASILVNSCGCNAPPSTAGSVSADLVVNDDDGPSLQLAATPLTLAEGLPNAGLLRVSRNTDSTASLLVNLTSSNTNEATLPVTATIPAGKSFVDVPITTINDGVTDGSQQVYFNATASGFAQGTVWVVVTDQNKPDFQIPMATVNNPTLQAMTLFNYKVSVKNTGFATAPSGVLIYGYLSKDDIIDAADTLISADTVTTSIIVGQTTQVVNAATVPNLPGQYKLLFKVNPTSALAELLVSNNTSQPINLTINPDYTATAVVGATYFVKGSKVPVTGTAKKSDGTAAANVAVEVHVIINGFRREITANTNIAGNYTAEFSPLTNEAGHYTVGAGYPGINNTEEQDAFDILGVRINNGNLPQFKVILNDTLKGSLVVQNLSSASLNNFSLVKVSLPNGAYIHFDTIPVFAGNATANLGYAISGSALSPGNNFEVAGLQAISTEAIIQTADMFYYCQAPNGFIEATISDINITVSQSIGERQVQFTLINKGSGSTGTIKINLPQVSWLTGVTPVELPAMSTGDTALVILKFSALAEVPFSFPIAGSVGINSENGNSFNIPFKFQKVSETTGSIKITATDQFTYYSDAAPKVAGAHVVIKNYYTGEIYAEGNTDNNGIFETGSIPEGTHKIVVEKDKHLPYTNTITINPGDTVEQTAFLNYQAITFSWTVVPTAIQDEYDITLTTQFETNVPVPVVTIDMPKTMPQLSGNEQFAFNAILTNHGLITAKDVAINLPTGDEEYEFITNYVPADLLAQQSIQVPVIMRRRAAQNIVLGRRSYGTISEFLGIRPPSNSTLAAGASNCQDFAGVVYWYKCSISTGLWQKGGTLFTYSGRVCSSGPGGGGGTVFPPITYGDGPGTGGYPTCAWCPCINCGVIGTTPTPPAATEKKSCVECLSELAQALLGCFGVDVPPDVSCFIKTLIENGGPKAYTICLIQETVKGAVQDAVVKKIGGKIPYLAQLLCLKALLDALETCLATAEEGFSAVKNTLNANKGELSSATTQIAENLKVVGTAYNLRINWNTEYFGDLSLSGGWDGFSPLVTPYIESLIAVPTATQDSIINAMRGFDIDSAAMRSFFTRWNRSIEARDLDILTPNAQYPGIINWTIIKAYSDSLVDAHNYAVNKGYASVNDMHSASKKELNEIIDGQKNAVCASVTVQLSQKLTMTREAFEGTLEIFNGHPTDKMDSLSVNVKITDENGVPANGLFEIQTKSLTNLSDITGTGNIAAQQKGAVKFIFIPEIGAAPTAPKLYNFGGSVRYYDPYAKAIVTLPLAAVQLTVNPSPNLFLHYFLQRNILGDDALTSPQIEPSVPAELAVMVENQGYGPAVNMTISSAQPKVIDNEKGLAINFSLIGSNFQGQPQNLGVTNINFGTIPALQTRIGEWYLTSSLLGKFVSYDAKVVHNNSFGNPDLSLVKGVKLHELTKSIKLYGEFEDGINDFLVNDYFDIHDVPDIIYFSQGNRTVKVVQATEAAFSAPVLPPSFTNTLTASATNIGWNYVELTDPGFGRYELVSVTRSDGQVIPLDNAWLTFVTLPVAQEPVYENKFHFVDTFATVSPVTYSIVWKPKNFNVPNIVSISGASDVVTTTQVQKLTVVFDKAIDPATFTYEDLNLTFQGGPNIITSAVTITEIDSVTFSVDVSSLTTGNGFYNFTAQAANIKDSYGISGLSGKQYTWTQFLTGPTVQAFLGIPDGNIASAFDTIHVLFNLPIDVSSVTPDRFTILRDSVVQSGTIVIDSVRADHKLFYLSGLKDILTQNGTYEFRVNLTDIRSESQEYGVQPQSVNLTVDNTGPVITSMETSNAGGLDAQHITFVNIKFNEDVVGFNTASVTLTRNGEAVPLNIAQLSNTDLKSWMAGNFGLLTYPDGNYTFTVNTSGFTDAIGNRGSTSQQVSWTVNHATLITISNLAVSPDLGFSGTDGVTSGQSLNVNFTLSSNAAKITISQVDLSGEVELAVIPNLAAGNISLPFTLASGGNTGIKVVATGANGGSDTAQQTLFIDQQALTAQWIFAGNQQLPVQVDTIPLSFSSRLLSEAGMLSAIQVKRNGNIIPSSALQIGRINDSAYNIYGLRQVSNLPGDYQLIYNLQPFSKYRTGMKGSGVAATSWKVLSTNHTPVANAGADITVTSSGTYSVSGAASFDPDSDPVTYRWIAPDGITLSDSTIAGPSFNITAANNSNTYSLLLVVSDGALFSTDVVEVTVNLGTSDISFSGLADSYCNNSGPVSLTGSPSGGTFSGAGISGNTFTPSMAGIGTHVITYTMGNKSFSQSTMVNAPVTPAFNAVDPICSGSQAPLLPTVSTNGITGTWNPATVSDTASGTYTFTPDAGQCAGTTTIAVTVNPAITPAFEAIASICAGSAAPELSTTSTNGITGTWNPATVSNTASATYTFTPDAGQCAGTTTIAVIVNPAVTPVFEAIASICTGSVAPVLPMTSINGITGTWNPATVSNTASATYTFTPDAGQCATTAVLTVTINPVPAVALSTFNPVCNTAPLFALTGGVPSGGTYSGTGVSNGQFDPAAAGVGTFIITYSYTNDNGCTNIATRSIQVTDCGGCTPGITASGATTFCEGGSVTLTASPGNSYLWSPGGETTQSITVNTSGSYTVKVTTPDCSATTAATSVMVTPSPAQPVITASGPTTFCGPGLVTLTSDSAASYLWSPGGETTQSITVSSSGNYSLTVKNTEGCSSAAATTQVIINPSPAVSLSTFDSVCNTTPAFALTGGAPSGGTYSGTGVSNGLFNPAAAGAGTFTITYSYTNGYGCTDTAKQTIKVGNCAPECTATIKAEGPTTFCEGGSVTLTASPGRKYLWMPGGQTTRSITVTKAGSYTVKITGSYGIFKRHNECVAVSKPVVVVVNSSPAVPVITASGPTTFPQGGTVVLKSGEAYAYLWSNGDTTRSIKVKTSGTYTVTVRNCNGCTATSAPVKVMVTDCYVYCPSGGSGNCTGYIDRVNFKTIDNSSGWNNGYGNFLSITANVWKGREDWIRVTPGYPRPTNIKMYVRVWIDWNQDGKFQDTTELVFAPFWPHNGSVSGKMLIPAHAKTGVTRMRVAMKHGSPPVACGNFESGEVEDYSIMVSEAALPKNHNIPAEGVPAVKPDYLLYPNPVANDLVIERKNFENARSKFVNTNMMIFNVGGKIVMQKVLRNNSETIDVGKLANGMYMVHLETNGYISTQKIVVSH